ncbi:DNA-binding domain-containing protein [Marinifilum sp.]|uniref:DNA-binding domain-containing protein n=1 Tax=Marinifilum sp. TaxID=2033137 RepID=UPI003BAD62AE
MTKVNVWLQDNLLTPKPNDFYGRVKPMGTIKIDDIAQEIIKEGTEYKKETIVDILSRSNRIIIEKMAEGYSVNTGVFYGHISVNGVFNGATDRFNPEEHRLIASFTSSNELRAELKKTQVEIVGTITNEPVIGKVIDSLSQVEDSTITPNNVILINGNRIKIAGSDASVGVYLVNQADNTRHKCEQIISNEPKQLLVMVPALEAGNYALEIVTQYSSGNSTVKEPRSTQFEHVLIVE